MAFEIGPAKRDVPRMSPDRFERNAIWRLCGWGSSAILALFALVATVQSDVGAKRLDSLFQVAAPPPVERIAARPSQKDPETPRLQAEVRSLTADRERLAVRLAKLEGRLEEVTGSIQRQPAAPPPPVTPPALPQIAAVSTTPAPAAAPAVTPSIPIIDPLAMPGITGSISGWTDKPATEDKQQHQEDLAHAPPLETREVPPPSRIAALPAREPVPLPPTQAAPRTEYGIDLGGAPDMDGLRARWAAIKANLGPLLSGLQPIAVRDRKAGSKELRLVAGPMPSLAAARQVCARFAAAQVTCRASKFDGEAVVQQ